MEYQVLARKWRPTAFADLVGQTHVCTTLTQALLQKRLHHAYLFTGTRGVGKTTLARIFARCLNCEQGETATPCGHCGACTAISEGRFPDLIEVDAASRTKVEDTRDLLDNVQYLPTVGRYKIYLIDEVHMLSGHSFNALLKTLEEPPAHVKFLLATTDPQKLPITVLSRCLQFHLKAITASQLLPHLQMILQAEKIPYETPALTAIARAANGSVRDALSILEQAIAMGSGQVNLATTETMLGLVAETRIVCLLEALAQQDAAALWQEIQALSALAVDFDTVLADLLTYIHKLAVQQFLPVEPTDDIEARLHTLRSLFQPEELQLLYQIGLIGRRDLALAPAAQMGFEMVLLRMLAFKPEKSLRSVAAAPVMTARTQPAVPQPQAARATPPTPSPARTQESPIPPPISVEDKPETPSDGLPVAPSATATDWGSMIPQLGISGMSLALAKNCTLQKIDNHSVQLSLSPQHAPLCNKSIEARLEEALSRYLQRKISLKITVETLTAETPATQIKRVQAAAQSQAEQAILTDTTVQSLVDTFAATVDVGSIRVVPDESNRS